MRPDLTASTIYTFGDFELDPERLELRWASELVHLNGVQIRLLRVLVQSADRVVTKQELLERVWDGRAVSDNVLTVAMARLRKALAARGARDMITSVAGVGYRFALPVAVCVPSPPASELREPFVGRESLLSHLVAALARARSGSGGVVMLLGEAGIGKTRAAEELARVAHAQGAAVAWGRCREFGDTPPLWPFTELLRELIAHAALDPGAARLESAKPYLSRLLPELSGAATTPPPLQKHLLFDAVSRALAAAAEVRPCVLLLDDLHRADPASLELLAYLLDDLPRMRLLLVGALRGKRAPESELLSRVLGHRIALRVALSPLSEPEVGAYLDLQLGAATPELRRAVFALSEGNPFFMGELTRQLRLRPADPAAPLAPPEAALDVLRQRIAALRAPARAHLAAAAVLGRSFGLAMLLRVTGLDFPVLSASLDEAVTLEIVAFKPGSRTELVFSHELLRSVLYDSLDLAERRQLHLAVVQALTERRLFERPAPADLAYHARAALPLGDLRQTVSFCMAASEAAVNVFAYADGARHLRQARETLDLLPNASPRLRLRLCLQEALLTRAYSTRGFIPLIAEVLSLGRELGDADTLARAAMLHDPYPGLPALPGAVQAFEAALCVLQRAPSPPPLTAAMLARLAASPPHAFDAAQSGVLLERAQQLAAASGEVLDSYSVQVARLYLTGGPAHPDPAPLVAELDQLYRDNALILSVPPVMLELHRAVRALQDGAPLAAREAIERGAARCRKLGCELLWHFERYLVIERLNLDRDAAARPALSALHERARKLAIAGTELLCAYDALVVLGAPPVDEPLRESLFPAEHDRPNIWALKLRALIAAGLHEPARVALRRVAAVRLRALPCDRDYLGTLGALAHAAVALEEREYAAELYDLLRPYAQRFVVHLALHCEGSVSASLGSLARVLGRRNQAAAHLRLACELSLRAGFTPCAEAARRQLAGLE